MKITELFESYDPFSSSLVKPIVIAEAGVNHEGRMDFAKKMIDKAVEGGADVIKFQTYKAETLASKNSPAYWDITREPTASQFKLFQKYDCFWKKQYEELKTYCDDSGIEFLSTPFDMESANFLNDLMDAFKISSSDITNRPFIEHICRFGKPVMLSTGASYLYEIKEAVDWIGFYGNQCALLHCVLNYPTEEQNANLGMIQNLKRHFPDKIIGYSDHTLPDDMKALEIATILGAVILEKHFTLDKSLPGNDHYHAMDKNDLEVFLRKINRVLKMTGSFKKHALPSESPARRNARRSLTAKRDIPLGKKIDMDDLTWKRPGYGISPKYIDNIIGCVALRDISEDEPLKFDMIIDE